MFGLNNKALFVSILVGIMFLVMLIIMVTAFGKRIVKVEGYRGLKESFTRRWSFNSKKKLVNKS